MAGKAILFSAPSGSGKTTIVREMLAAFPQLAFSVSVTTRKSREGEVHGKDYYFLSPEDFQRKKDADEFVEWEEVYQGLYYGTLKAEVERLWAMGKDVIFDVDVKGGLALKKYFGEKALSIFVAVPSMEVLRQRLISRGTETPESLMRRLEKAEYEAGFSREFDRVIVNDRVERAVEESKEAYLAFAESR